MNNKNNTLPFRKRIINSGILVLSWYAVSQVLRIIISLIMTRLLMPEVFGIMAVANVIMIGVALFAEFGIKQNIIQSKRGTDPDFLNTAWVVQIFRGLFIWFIALIVSSALYLSNKYLLLPENSVYAEHTLPYIIGVLSFSAVISGFQSTNIAVLNRKLNLASIVKIELASQLLSVLMMVGLAIVYRSIWVLVIGSLGMTLFRTIMSHTLLEGHKNRFCWDKRAFYELLGFGKWMLLGSVLTFLASSGDRLVLGSLVDSNTMAMYAIAFLIIGALQQVIIKLSSTVAMPALSEVIRTNRKHLSRAYYRLRMPIDILSSLTAGVMFFSGGLLTELLYDSRYEYSGYIVEIICIMLIFERYSVASQCFIALGKPRDLIPVVSCRIAFLYFGMPYAFHLYGTDGALWVIACSRLPSLPVLFYLKHKYGFINIFKEVLAIPMLGAGFAAGMGFKELLVYSGLLS